MLPNLVMLIVDRAFGSRIVCISIAGVIKFRDLATQTGRRVGLDGSLMRCFDQISERFLGCGPGLARTFLGCQSWPAESIGKVHLRQGLVSGKCP
jgi:hypothetical protein